MTREMAEELLAYNTWANQRVLGAVDRLDSDQFTRTLGGSFSSVQETLVHMMWAEWVWVERWQGHSPKELFVREDFPSSSAIRARWRQIQAAQEDFAQSAAPEDLHRVISYTNRAGEVWEYALWRMLYHAVNHSSYHRGQVTNMLRLLGAEPAATDFLEWWDEGRHEKEGGS